MAPSKREQAIAAARLAVEMKGGVGHDVLTELLKAVAGNVDTGAEPGSDLANYADEFLHADDSTVIRLPENKVKGQIRQRTVVFVQGRRAAVVNVVDVGGEESTRHLSVDVRGFLDGSEYANRVISWGEGMHDNNHDAREWAFNTVIVGEEVRERRPAKG